MLTIHHLGVSQSDRLVWLCEELEIPYELKIHQRDPMLSPQSIKDLHPLGAAPIIQDGDLTLAETGACVEYIIHKHGNGRLVLSPSHKDYATYLYWFHYASATLAPSTSRIMVLNLAQVDKSNPIYKIMGDKQHGYFQLMDDHLKTRTWLAGEEFTAADIMPIFALTTGRAFSSTDLSAYPNILAYLKRVTSRPAYQRYHEKADPTLPIFNEGPSPPTFMELKQKI